MGGHVLDDHCGRYPWFQVRERERERRKEREGICEMEEKN